MCIRDRGRHRQLGYEHGLHVTPAQLTARSPPTQMHRLLSGKHTLFAGQYPPSLHSTAPAPQNTGAQ